MLNLAFNLEENFEYDAGVDDISGMESAHFLHQQVERRADHLRWTEGADTMENIQE